MVTRKKPAEESKEKKRSATKTAKASGQATAARRTAKKTAGESTPAEGKPTPAKAAAPAVKEVELLGLVQMASILRLHPLQLKQMAQTGKVPAVVVDGEWRFNKDLVQEALRRRSLGR